MDIAQINHSIISFSSKLLELKENLEKTSIDLDKRSQTIKTLESSLSEKDSYLSKKEKEIEEESDRLESFKKASLMNKLYKELDSLKNENKLLKKSFYRKDLQKTDSINFNFPVNTLNLEMSLIIEKSINIQNTIQLEKLQNKILLLENNNLEKVQGNYKPITRKVDFDFLKVLKKDLDSIFKNMTQIIDTNPLTKVTYKGIEYIFSDGYLYNDSGEPVGYKTQKSYKLYKKKKPKK